MKCRGVLHTPAQFNIDNLIFWYILYSLNKVSLGEKMPHLPKANRDLMRGINRNLVFNLIQRQGPIARADLARISGLSPATVTGIVNELIEIGLVHEIGTGESSGGRRPVQLCINRGAGVVVGIKFMEQNISSAVTDLDAQVLFHEMNSIPSS